ncbi:MAG: DUF4391 domain-containing protein [Clostridiaceae bacterium]|nr:DUF4391 domain-containing protein [Clostridiaceae bacterium]
MLHFPESTFAGKRIPKEEFYRNMDFTTTQRRAFVDGIENILWRNVISEQTLNVSKGEKVSQIDVLQINLKRKEYNKVILNIIEKATPRHLLFILKKDDQFQLYIHYKEEYQKGRYKIVDAFCTDWLKKNEFHLKIDGLTLDSVYENFVYQIAGRRIEKTEGIQLSETIAKAQEIKKITKRISKLQNRKRKEKQFNFKLKIANEIKQLNVKLQEIKQ